MPSNLVAELGSDTGTFPKTVGEAAAALRELANYTPASRYTKRAIETAARLTGFSYWRTFDLWYRKARRLEPFEREAIARALEEKQDAELRNELHDLRLRLTRLEALLATTDRPVAHSDRPMVRADGLARRPLAVSVSK